MSGTEHASTSHPLTAYAATTPLEVGVGHMLLNIADPTPGHEDAYTRWYEDDHYFSAAMMAPFVFSGRRWVADAGLPRHGRPGGSFDPPTAGGFAATYWIAPGHLDDYLAWSAGAGPALDAAGRGFTDRTLVFTTFADHLGTVSRDSSVPDARFALLDPPARLVVLLVDASSAADRPALAADLQRTVLPDLLSQSADVSRVMLFQGAAASEAMRPGLRALQQRADLEGRRLVLLAHVDGSAERAWDTVLTPLRTSVEEGGAQVEWLATYVPARMGGRDASVA